MSKMNKITAVTIMTLSTKLMARIMTKKSRLIWPTSAFKKVQTDISTSKCSSCCTISEWCETQGHPDFLSNCEKLVTEKTIATGNSPFCLFVVVAKIISGIPYGILMSFYSFL